MAHWRDPPDDSVDSFRPGVGRTTRKGYKWFTEVALPAIAPSRNRSKNGTSAALSHAKSLPAPHVTSPPRKKPLQRANTESEARIQESPGIHDGPSTCCQHCNPGALGRAATFPSPYDPAHCSAQLPALGANCRPPGNQSSFAIPSNLPLHQIPTFAGSSSTQDEQSNRFQTFGSTNAKGVPIVPRRHSDNVCSTIPSVQEGSSRALPIHLEKNIPSMEVHQSTLREREFIPPGDLNVWLPEAILAYLAVLRYIEHSGEKEASMLAIHKQLQSYAELLNLKFNLDDEDPVCVIIQRPESEQLDLDCRFFVQKVLILIGDFVNLDPYFIFAVGKELKDWIIKELYSPVMIGEHQRWREEIEKIYEEPPSVTVHFRDNVSVDDSESLPSLTIDDIASFQAPPTTSVHLLVEDVRYSQPQLFARDIFLAPSPLSTPSNAVSSRELIQNLTSSVSFKDLPGGLRISYPSMHQPDYRHVLLLSESGLPPVDSIPEDNIILPKNRQLKILIEPYRVLPKVSLVSIAIFALAQIPQLLSSAVLIALHLLAL
ncbi:hypothetical protein DL96DRAFT_1709137 [Flagelloscypha sp. PMI_526]|nr:hypothetical protein DL96DRAFT_1709137 [Flagelloscypha sp. PMI_526]